MVRVLGTRTTQVEFFCDYYKCWFSCSGTLPYGISKKRLELRKNEKRARSPFFKTNSQDSYRRDGIFEKA